MDTVASSSRGSRRGSQDETPFPLEFDIVARGKRVVHREGRSQDETAPFPLEFDIVARRARQSQDETSPFLLEFKVILPGGQPAFVHTARPPRVGSRRRSSPRVLPVLRWHGVDASTELREYAARIASGESLPAYRGPILANGELPRVRAAVSGAAVSGAVAPAAVAPAAVAPTVAASEAVASTARSGATQAKSALPAEDSKAFVKFALALMVMTALVIASAVLGDDAKLRGIGQSVSRWVTGRDSSFETLRPVQTVHPSASESPAPRR